MGNIGCGWISGQQLTPNYSKNQCVPVFVDVEIPTYNIDVEMLKKLFQKKRNVFFLAHTLGNPFNLDAVMEIAAKYILWVI
jgi:CDP-6-deoxy-D-xylo-4-hexulose-3-dehydrase